MPGGISTPGPGYTTFCAIKFAGYMAAGHFLSMQYDRDVSPWKVGAVSFYFAENGKNPMREA